MRGELQLLGEQPVDLVGVHQCKDHQPGGEDLRTQGGQCNPEHPQPEDHHKDQVKEDVGETGGHQEIERTLGVPNRPQDTRTDIVEEGRDDAEKVDPQIGQRMIHDVGRSAHCGEQRAGDQQAENGHAQSSHDRH